MGIRQLLLSAVIAAVFVSCKAQKISVVRQVDSFGNDQPIEDSVIRRLRENNDLIVAYAVENFAWVRSVNYLIIASKNDEWTGYWYYVNLMHNQSQSNVPGNINPAEVNQAACDSLVQFITQTKAWNIRGDSGQNFCPGSNKSCNINDAAGARLWIITQKGLVNPSYYAPEFFEQCCPGDKDRALFLSITKKIQDLVSVQGISR
jgi:hypothetical protein